MSIPLTLHWLILITGSFELLESSSSLIKKDLKKRIFEAVNSADISNVEIEELDVELGKAFGKAANRLIQKASLNNTGYICYWQPWTNHKT